jgi:hypothetical protein
MPSARAEPEPRGLQDRIEEALLGRAMISAFVAITVVALVLWNLPDSDVRARALPVVEPYIWSTGLDQNWGVFAPDPRREVTNLVARATYADGRVEEFEFPRGDPLLFAYWDYRWRKWDEWAVGTEHQDLWQPTAAWFAREAADAGEAPLNVTLVKRSYALLPPGPGPERGAWQENAYYTLTVTQPAGGP